MAKIVEFVSQASEPVFDVVGCLNVRVEHVHLLAVCCDSVSRAVDKQKYFLLPLPHQLGVLALQLLVVAIELSLAGATEVFDVLLLYTKHHGHFLDFYGVLWRRWEILEIATALSFPELAVVVVLNYP